MKLIIHTNAVTINDYCGQEPGRVRKDLWAHPVAEAGSGKPAQAGYRNSWRRLFPAVNGGAIRPALSGPDKKPAEAG